jgi:hypothetical protein
LENKRFCNERKIRLSGRGRGKKSELKIESVEQQKIFKSDLRKRSVIDGRIGSDRNEQAQVWTRSNHDQACDDLSICNRNSNVCDECREDPEAAALIACLLALFVLPYMVIFIQAESDWDEELVIAFWRILNA